MDSYKSILDKFEYNWIYPPMLIGGHALSYHNIREPGYDLDVIVSQADWNILKEMYPTTLNLFGGKTEKEVDATLNIRTPVKLDIIKTLWQHNYNDFLKDSIYIEESNVRVISIPNLLYIKSFPAVKFNDKKSKDDVQLILDSVIKERYSN